MNRNPFNFSEPVKENDFYNRKEELEVAIGFLKSLQSFSVVGERRIGKTSFLHHILSEETLGRYGIDIEKYVIIYLNISSLHEITKEKFIRTIVKKIKKRTKIKIGSRGAFEEFRTYIDELDFNNKGLIIFLDEFEGIVPILDSDFSYWLRFIFQMPNVMVITASQTTIGEIDKSGGMASPLYSIFGNIFLGLFTMGETEDMITNMFLKGGIELEKKEIDFLADLSGGNPYLIQLMGYHYYKEKEKEKRIVPEKFRENMFHHTWNQFENYWNHLTEDEKDFLINPKNMNHSIEYTLRRKGFLIKENGKLKVFSKLFEEFLTIKKEKIKKKHLNKKHLNFANYVSYIKRWKPSARNVIEGVIAGVIVGIIIIFLSLLIT